MSCGVPGSNTVSTALLRHLRASVRRPAADPYRGPHPRNIVGASTRRASAIRGQATAEEATFMDSFAKPLRRYALSIGLVAAATAASMLFAPAVAGARAELFVAAVFLSTWFGGGISGGLLATVVGAVIYDYYFVDSRFSFAIETLQ